MKKLVFLGVWLVALCVVSSVSNAAMYYEMDADTAILMRPIAVSSGDTYTLKYIGSNPGGSGDKVAGNSTTYGDTMTYAVGFQADIEDQAEVGPYEVILTIGLNDKDIAAMITGSYDGFLLPVSNDNNQDWIYRAYVDDGINPVIYSDWKLVHADSDEFGGVTANLLVETANMDYSKLAGIGFEVKWSDAGSSSDTFHTSVVPVPGAILLGLLGLGASGLKLRKYA